MSHEITHVLGTDCYAYRESTGAAWHGLGQAVADDAPNDAFFASAGYDFRVEQAAVKFSTDREGTLATALGLRVNLHSVTKQPLGVVSDRYVRHQPKQVAAFFNEVFRLIGVRADSAGVLFGGRSLFASADLGGIRVVGDDWLRSNLLLTSWLDGTGATERRQCETRVVCANTLAAATAEKKESSYRKATHRSEFDAEAMAQGFVDYVEDQRAYAERCRLMAQAPVQSDTAGDLVAALFAGKRGAPKADAKRVRTIRGSAGYTKVLDLFNGAGRGANLPGAKGTLWGLFNAVTEYTTHYQRAASTSHRFMSVIEGEGAKLNDAAMQLFEGFATDDPDALAIVEAADAIA